MVGRVVDPVASAVSGGPWSPLRIAVYRSLWIAGIASNVGTFMYLASAGWAMAILSDSPTLTGLVQAAWAVPGFLLALHAGAFADLLDRRRLILASQAAALTIAVVLAIVQWSGSMTPGVLLVGTFLESVALTAAAPAFMALTPDLVGPERLAQAIGLDAISRNAATAIGPALAGLIIALEGPGAVFAFNAVSFLGVMTVVGRWRGSGPRDTAGRAVRSAIGAGVRHVWATTNLLRPVIRAAMSTTTTASIVAVLPLFASQRLGVSSSGFGVLSAALGLGSVVMVWVLPRVHAPLHPERTTMVAAVIWSTGTLILASSGSLAVALIGVLLAGAGAMGVLNVLFSNFTVQLPAWMRGRGASIVMLMVWLGTSLGAIGWGVLASEVGLPMALAISALVNIGVAAVSTALLRVQVPEVLRHPVAA